LGTRFHGMEEVVRRESHQVHQNVSNTYGPFRTFNSVIGVHLGSKLSGGVQDPRFEVAW